MTTHELFIDDDGTIQLIHDDDLALLFCGDEVDIRRASHVEPVAGGGWTADLSPVNGPVLGPFATRRDALKAEVAWLAAQMTHERLTAKERL